jgi:hypothetical protein
MKRAITAGLVAGGAGALVVALLEALLGASGPFLASAAAALGLLLPIGALGGLGLVAVRGLLPPERRPRDWIGTLRAADEPRPAARILAVGGGTLIALPVCYRLIFFFLTGFHHQGLAALSLTVSLGAMLLVAALAIRAGGSALARVLPRAPAVLRRPWIALALVVAAWLVATLPPLLRGPEDTAGLFGFVGFLRKDGLGAGPLLSLLALLALAAALLWPLLARDRRWTLPTAALGLVAAALGPIWADAVIAGTPQVVDRLDAGGGLAPLTGKLLRRLADSDRDGHADWMGGRDCDDTNPSIYPGARDVPDNGIDEDCSGGDLELAVLAAAAEPEAKTDVATPEPQPPELPEDVSLLLITIDSLRWNAPGFMGYERDTTPNLDALVARGGTVYERAYALGSYTGQAIPPMLTGKYGSELERTNRHEVRISRDELFAAEVVCGKEVKCGAVLSHFLFSPSLAWNQGFQDWTVVSAAPPGPGHIDQKYNSHFVANESLKWLKQPENTAGRFWFWAHFMDPHKEYLTHRGIEKFGTDRRSLYDHEVRYTDKFVGQILDYFHTLPAAERTVVIVTADHGEAFNEHGRWCHGKELWEEIIRVPLAVIGPGVATKRIARQTSLIDIFPTVLELFGHQPPEGTHGRSLLTDWVEGQELPERPVIADQPRNPYYETRRVFLHDGWKLHHLPDTGSWRFFRLTDDYERGDSLVETEPEEFARIKAAYELFLATAFRPIPPGL